MSQVGQVDSIYQIIHTNLIMDWFYFERFTLILFSFFFYFVLLWIFWLLLIAKNGSVVFKVFELKFEKFITFELIWFLKWIKLLNFYHNLMDSESWN